VIDNASGEYLVWVDSDDMIPEDYVLNLVEFIEKNPRLGGAATIREIANLSSYAAKLERLSLLRIRGTSVLDGHGIFRLRAMRQVGGFDTQIKGAGEDLDMIARIRRAGWPLSVTNVKFYHKPHLWRQIWTNKVRDGYGTHYLGHRHKGWISVWDKTIPIVCILGFRDSLTLYKLTGQKTSFFVPLYKSLKAIPWWLGFVKSHIDGYGHAPD
jgi:GT2 family glycosyltransferase